MIWDEKPKSIKVGMFGNAKFEYYHTDQMDAWLKKVKPYIELAENILETFNQNLSPDEVLALYKSRTFTQKRYAVLSEALLKAEKLEAIKKKLIELKKDWRGDRIENIVINPLLEILEGV